MIRWNPITNNRNTPKQFGTYLVTISSVESDEDYCEHRRVTLAQFQRAKGGYRWVYDDEGGTNTLVNTCESKWTYYGTEYEESIVAWAKPEPYVGDWSAVYSTVKDVVQFGICDDGTMTANIRGVR